MHQDTWATHDRWSCEQAGCAFNTLSKAVADDHERNAHHQGDPEGTPRPTLEDAEKAARAVLAAEAEAVLEQAKPKRGLESVPLKPTAIA